LPIPGDEFRGEEGGSKIHGSTILPSARRRNQHALLRNISTRYIDELESISSKNSKIKSLGEYAEDLRKQQNLDTENGVLDVEKRKNIVTELVFTERDYVRDLGVIIEVFYMALKQIKIVPPQDISILFSNVSELLTVNLKLLAGFEKQFKLSLQNQRIGQVFIEMADKLSAYSIYCGNHTISSKRIIELKQDPKFVKIFK